MADATALERAHLTIRGVRAELVLEDGHLTLSKDGPPSTNLSFAVDQVRGTVLDPGSRGGRGWIHVAVVGGTLAPPGELAAMSDPYTIPLTSRSAVTARRLARIVEKHLHERGLPSEPTFAASALERGRFSSGVALAQAPGATRTVVDLRADGGGPPLSPSRNGSSLATGRSVSSPATSYPSARPRDREDDDPRAVRIAAAEAAIDERAASDGRAVADEGAVSDGRAASDERAGSDGRAASDERAAVDGRAVDGDRAVTGERAATETARAGTSVEPSADEPGLEPAGAPGGWVEPSGPSPGEATEPSLTSPAPSPAPAPSPVSAPSPAPGSSRAPNSSPPPIAPPPAAAPTLAPPTVAPPTVVARDLATELRQLGELYASGVLTDAEFEQAKARVLR